jgi:hypothetical protein
VFETADFPDDVQKAAGNPTVRAALENRNVRERERLLERARGSGAG